MNVLRIINRGKQNQITKPSRGRFYKRHKYTSNVEIPAATGGDIYSYNNELEKVVIEVKTKRNSK